MISGDPPISISLEACLSSSYVLVLDTGPRLCGSSCSWPSRESTLTVSAAEYFFWRSTTILTPQPQYLVVLEVIKTWNRHTNATKWATTLKIGELTCFWTTFPTKPTKKKSIFFAILKSIFDFRGVANPPQRKVVKGLTFAARNMTFTHRSPPKCC